MWSWIAKIPRDKAWLWCVIAFGVALRLSHISDPYLADFHAWRQADTAAFAHGFLIDSLSPLDPSIDRYPCEHRNVPFGRVESEWPGVQWLSALPLAAFGVTYPPAWYLRLVSIAFFVLASLYLAALVRRLDGNRTTATLSVLAFATFPLSIFFTRTVQPDGPALCFAVGLLFHLDSWLDPALDTPTHARTQRIHAIAACAMAALALLTKVSNAFMGLPAIYVIVRRRGWLGALRDPWLWAWGVATLIVPALWYQHARHFAWSFGIWADRGASKFTDAAFASDLEVWKRLGNREVYEILTWGGLFLLLVGLSRLRRSPSARLGAVWLLAVMLFVLATLRGNNRHIYYQLPLVLPAAILVAHGMRTLWQRGVFARVALLLACVVHGAITHEVLWGQGDRLSIVPYFKSDAALIEGVELLRRHVPEGEGFISADRHPGLFYNSGRRGYFATAHPPALMHCARNTTRFLLVDRRGQQAMLRMLKTKPHLRQELREIGHGRRYFMWTYDPVPPRRASTSKQVNQRQH